MCLQPTRTKRAFGLQSRSALLSAAMDTRRAALEMREVPDDPRDWMVSSSTRSWAPTKRLGKKKARRSGPSTLAPAGQFDLPARGDYSGGDPREHHTVQHETGLAREVRNRPRRKRAALLGDDRARDVVVDRAVRLDHKLDLAREHPGTRVASYEAVAVITHHLRAIPAGSGPACCCPPRARQPPRGRLPTESICAA